MVLPLSGTSDAEYDDDSDELEDLDEDFVPESILERIQGIFYLGCENMATEVISNSSNGSAHIKHQC